MTEESDRRGLHVFLSTVAWEAWDEVAADYGITKTALAEVLGRRWTPGNRGILAEEEVALAKNFDRERRSRRRG